MQVEDPYFGYNYCRDRYVNCYVDTAGNSCLDKFCLDRYFTCDGESQDWASTDPNRCNDEYNECKDASTSSYWSKALDRRLQKLVVCKTDYPGNYADTYCSTQSSWDDCESDHIGFKAAVTV